MLPNPLHPAVVHFPIVFMTLLPLVAVGALWAMHDGGRLRNWGWVVLTAGALFVSALVAQRAGSAEEDVVEHVVPEQAIAAHEEAADTFVVVAGIVFVVAVLGLIPGVVGKSGRGLALVGSLALVGLGWRVGDLGGKLVYQHGAANAYLQPGAGGPTQPAVPGADSTEQEERR